MGEYAFGADEYVVMKAQDVRRDGGKGFPIGRGGELMLTNRNIVLTRKGITGKVKGFDTFPLSEIRIVGGAPQCRLDSSEFMEEKLEVAFEGGIESFVFGSLDNKKEIRAFINEINRILLGKDAPDEALGKGRLESFMDEENLADMVGRVFGSFENAFQRKRSEAAPDVAMRCPSCDASLKGRPGSTIPCPYCGSYVTLGAAASNDRLI